MLLRRNDQRKDSPDGTRRAVRSVVGAFSAVLFMAAVFFVLPGMAHAARVDLGLGYASATGLATTDIRTMVGNVLKGFFALLGVVAVLLILYAGVIWMTAAGNEEKISQAKKILINATIGLLIMMAAYAITAFIFGAILGAQGGEGGGGGTAGLAGIHCANCAESELGKILEYHYPEAGQAGVARNTKIAITLKKPLVLSTIFKNYDDKGTYAVNDDVLCDPNCAARTAELKCSDKIDENTCVNAIIPSSGKNYCSWQKTPGACVFALNLNTDNFKILPNAVLGAVQNSADKDDDFNTRYIKDPTIAAQKGALVDPAPLAMVTVVNTSFDPNNKGQTLVIKPKDPIGSSSVDVNYRVALRGGDNGIMVWDDPNAPGVACPRQNTGEKTAKCVKAFDTARADGSYFWSFTTSTALDTTPPQIVFVGPRLAVNPVDRPIVRNQLLQIYFDEPIDPSTATGKTGSGGFSQINVEAKCLSGLPAGRCPWNQTGFAPINGTLDISNRYRTVEFTPSAPCEGISENSCGDPVYCLPKNVELRVTVKPSTVDTANPPAGVFPPDGVTDMVGNSSDGNMNGKGEGPSGTYTILDKDKKPQTVTLTDYDYNLYFTSPASDLSTYSDTATWRHQVNDEVDLVPPVVTDILPLSLPPESLPFNPDKGPSLVPTTLDVAISWSKTMSPSSMVAGTTVYILSREWQKKTGAKVSGCGTGSGDCDCATGIKDCADPLAQPTVIIDAGKPVEDKSVTPSRDITVMKLLHRPFYSAGELGWGEQEAKAVLEANPAYLPVVRNKVKDDRQNCFYPSQGYLCGIATSTPTTPDIPAGTGFPSCLNRDRGRTFTW